MSHRPHFGIGHVFELVGGGNVAEGPNACGGGYAVGGLSGSAVGVVRATVPLLQGTPFNLLSRRTMPCAINLLEGCYGYALLPYQRTGHDFTQYGKSGYFPGVEADIFADDKGGVLAILP